MLNKIKPKRMLAILAHPEDEIFAAGGTLAKYAHQHVQVILLCATRGEAGILGVKPEETGEIRERELRKAAEHLGIEVHFLDYQDGELARIKPEILLETIWFWIVLVQPQVFSLSVRMASRDTPITLQSPISLIRIASQLGFWGSVFCAVFGGFYLLVLIYSFSTEGFVNPAHPFVQLAGGIVTFLSVPGLVILFTAIRFVNEEDDKVLGSLGLSFILLFAATVGINRFVQLTVIQQSLPDVPIDLTRFLPYSPGSLMFALENLAWGFFSSLAAVFVAPLFSASPLNKTIRWLFILYAIFSFGSVIGFATNILISTGPIAWGPILLALYILLSVYFRNFDRKFK